MSEENVEPAVDPASLSLLEDIVVPEPVSWWPLAPACWILISAVALAIGIIGWRTFRRWKANAYRRVALRELEALVEDPVGIPALLKRVALSAWPLPEIAGLCGESWIAFLRNSSPGSFDDQSAKALLEVDYGSGELEPGKYPSLLQFARDWIINHQRPHS